AVEKLLHRIVAQLHTRSAAAITCTLALLLGCVLSMKLRGYTPLVVYLAVFLLTLMAMILIHGPGQSMVSRSNRPVFTGLLVIWSANLMLLLITALAYRKVARN